MADVLPHSATGLAVKGGVTSSLARGHVAHRSRGRIRLRFGSADRKSLPHIATALRGMPNVTRVEVHPATGSVIVHHRPDDSRFLERTTDLVENAGLFALTGGDDPAQGATRLTAVEKDAAYLADHSKAGKLILQATEHLNRAAKNSTGGWVDLRVLLPAAVGVSALVFAGVETSPLWVPLVLFSLQSFNSLHQPNKQHALPPGQQRLAEQQTPGVDAIVKPPAKQAPARARAARQS